MSKYVTSPDTNTSGNEAFNEILDRHLSRRTLMRGSLGAAAAMLSGVSLSACGDSKNKTPTDVTPSPVTPEKLGFSSLKVEAARLDSCRVPEGYTAQTFNPWGEPLFNTVPDDTFTTSLKKGDRISEWQRDASNSSDEQLFSVGMHHDGMYYYPLNGSSEHGLLVLNHEYLDQDAMHNALTPRRDADSRYLAEIARKEINGHGISIMEIKLDTSGNWHIVRDSKYNRRFTAGHGSEMLIAGPVAAKPSLTETAYTAKHGANKTRGTINNCGNGFTPWGTYLTCEENWNQYFVNRGTVPADQNRIGINASSNRGYPWDTVVDASERDGEFARWNLTPQAGKTAAEDFRNEANGFGYVVEIDPYNPASKAVKRTSMGRFKHEGAAYGKLEAGKPISIYSGDDQTNDYVYKFVSDALWDAKDATVADNATNRLDIGAKYLDKGTLYVARFNDDGTGRWLKLTPDARIIAADGTESAITLAQKYADVIGGNAADVTLADIIIHTRLAADWAGATKMDRPEWTAVNPLNGDVYLTLTNNTSDHRKANVDPANPRKNNVSGHIIRWHDDANQVDFTWDVFVFGDAAGSYIVNNQPDAIHNSGLTADNQFASPDGLAFDARGILWIQTDNGLDSRPPGSSNDVGNAINDQVLAVIPGKLKTGSGASTIDKDNQGDLRRFFVGPNHAEVTGFGFTPDNTTLFINIQHPSNWPAYNTEDATRATVGTVRPRASTVAIRRKDGGKIGE